MSAPTLVLLCFFSFSVSFQFNSTLTKLFVNSHHRIVVVFSSISHIPTMYTSLAHYLFNRCNVMCFCLFAALSLLYPGISSYIKIKILTPLRHKRTKTLKQGTVHHRKQRSRSMCWSFFHFFYLTNVVNIPWIMMKKSKVLNKIAAMFNKI